MSNQREYPDRPIPGVGAVVLRESLGRAEVLLIRRRTEPMAGSWSLPGGAIEVGETVREACVREVLEETGLKVEAVAEVECVDIIVRDDARRVQYHYLIVDILCRVLAGELLAGEDASEAVWADAEYVLEFGDFALTLRACTVIAKALRMNEGSE
jgi:8-oxo-dGTP diphosphatase